MSGPSKVTGLPAGTIAFATALYAVLYLVWEQSGWGSATARDLIGNVAFMPINLGVLTLFVLASKREILDPAVRRANGNVRSAVSVSSESVR